ncbi:hypothetical protein CCHOA_08250 [Corynebacterium choanae]|uniref:Uncharacterized protein n=1 Tax=Corynebacterium choanae TaxID=1862358 RepID=A0A3G6J7E7_9CORY|nr:hypothetical protein CCHOA_08250 [Corynebacterium choanae]
MAPIQKYKTATGTAWRVQYREPAGKTPHHAGFQDKGAGAGVGGGKHHRHQHMHMGRPRCRKRDSSHPR